MVGGRWNSRGNVMLYTSQSIALCVTEIAVHVPFGILQKIFNWYILKFLMKIFRIEKITKDWQTFPHSNSTQMLEINF